MTNRLEEWQSDSVHHGIVARVVLSDDSIPRAVEYEFVEEPA